MSGNCEGHVTPMGYKWRSSKWFILATIAVALYAGLFPLPSLVNLTLIPIRDISLWISSAFPRRHASTSSQRPAL
jgi:hypothetical protein